MKLSSLFSKTTASVQNALENTIMWNGFSVQELLLEVDAEFYFLEYAEFCMVEYLQVLVDEVSYLV